MTAPRLLSAFAVMLCLAAPAFAQTEAKPASVAARLSALEKENAALRQDVDRLQALPTQTRHDMIVMEGNKVGSVTYMPPQPGALVQPMSIPSQQAQANAAIQSQGVQQQLNNLQLQQNMAQDRTREQQLFQPTPPFGTP